jgi:hypothetical protein
LLAGFFGEIDAQSEAKKAKEAEADSSRHMQLLSEKYTTQVHTGAGYAHMYLYITYYMHVHFCILHITHICT